MFRGQVSRPAECLAMVANVTNDAGGAQFLDGAAQLQGVTGITISPPPGGSTRGALSASGRAVSVPGRRGTGKTRQKRGGRAGVTARSPTVP